MSAGQGNDLNLGTTVGGKELILRHDLRLQHTSIMGNTGAGKSRYTQSLIRQDIRSFPETKCGLLLIDPDGDVFDGIMDWVTATNRLHLPIIPIDLSRPDQIISYNPLRRRGAVPSVILDNFVKAAAYAWGQAGTDETPLFERWATNFLYMLYHQGKTLADAAHLFTLDGYMDTDLIEDPMIRRDWIAARRNPRSFEEAIQSTLNRFRRFLLNDSMRAMFGQTHASLDLGQALSEGQIILVNLAGRGGRVSRENADLFATLLLSDLQVAAEERGKYDGVKPFYVFLDEFWRFLTPTMAENLARARGFGIGMTMINQFPRQILNGGPFGQRILDEVNENTRTKVFFRLKSRPNLELAAELLFTHTFDPMSVKYQHESTKVLGYELGYLPSFGQTSTDTNGGGEGHGHTDGTSHAENSNWAHTDTTGHSSTISHSETDGTSDTWGDNWNESSGQSGNRGTSGGHSSGGSRSRGSSTNKNQGEGFGLSGNEVVNDGRFKRRFDRADDGKSWNVNASTGEGENESDGENWNDSSGWNRGAGWSNGASRGGSRSRGVQRSSTDGFSETESFSESDMVGGGVTNGVSTADTTSTNTNWSRANGTSVNLSPMLFPQLGKEKEGPVFWSIDEQLFLAMKSIYSLQDREAYILAGDMTRPELIRTPDISFVGVSKVCTDLCIGVYQQVSGLALPLIEAIKRVRDRDDEFTNAAVILAGGDEFNRPRRSVKSSVKDMTSHAAARPKTLRDIVGG